MSEKVSEIAKGLTSISGQEQKVLGLAVSILDNLIITNQETSNHDSELCTLAREFKSHTTLVNPNEEALQKVKASVKKGQKYATK